MNLAELLERSAECLEREASGIKIAHITPAGRWSGEYAKAAKADHDEMRALAKLLRKSAKYNKANPFGGPAVLFDACANSIRAGEPIKVAMADFGLAWAKKPRRRIAGAPNA